ncbi:Pao retrotransposon peptidase [Popillia japonica]|uniref:Pao retrotransposon peptidase n=1 Tax=Popillia japonica TaxID=7064 RepID=A0AAW1IZN3_POPJA
MDDLISGAENVEEAMNIITDINNILKDSGFHLRQWISNKPEILNFPASMQNLQYVIGDSQNCNKTLGSIWHATKDYFAFQSNSGTHTKFTKRIVLSVISQIYDPLGLIGPVITKAKLILQLLWQSKLNWDQSLSVELELIRN